MSHQTDSKFKSENIEEDVKQLELFTTAGGILNHYTHLAEQLLNI